MPESKHTRTEKRLKAQRAIRAQGEMFKKINFLNTRFEEEGLEVNNENIGAFRAKYQQVFDELGDRVEVFPELPVFRRKIN